MKEKQVACFVFPSLPLQLLLKEKPSWRGQPCAVLRPQSTSLVGEEILWLLNERALKKGLRAGMRLGEALDLEPTLRAGHVGLDAIEACEEELGRALLQFSPRVEKADASAGAEGVFYVDPSGLDRLYGGGRAWSRAVDAYFSARGFWQSAVIGFGRYPTYALAQYGMRKRTRIQFFFSKQEQTQTLLQVPLSVLNLAPKLVDELALLGVRNLGPFLQLDPAELEVRMGREARLLHERVRDRHRVPIQPKALAEPLFVQIEVSPPDAHMERLLFGIRGALYDLMSILAAKGLYLSALHIVFAFERGGAHAERLEPAEPGRDVVSFVELVRLRLANVTLKKPVQWLRLEPEVVHAQGDQLPLFGHGESHRRGRKSRDQHAAERAIARVRAAFGADTVQTFSLREGHLPEARFSSEPRSSKSSSAKKRAVPRAPAPPFRGARPRVRRLLSKPKRLSSNDVSGVSLVVDEQRVTSLLGPYRVCGGWWHRQIERDYYYGQTERGSVLWLFRDRVRQAWFLHGLVD